MEICYHGHDEIVHNERKCPICELIETKNEEIASLRDEIADLTNQYEEMKIAYNKIKDTKTWIMGE